MPITKATPILITGSGGFIGRNLAARLAATGYETLLLYDLNTPASLLEAYSREAGFVFHLAGVNRPQDPSEFYTGNATLTETLMALLAQNGNRAPVVLSSSLQAGNGTDYAKSKEQAEAAVFAHGAQNQSPVYVYRLPGVFGKWSRPAYNSVVATFCHNAAHGQPLEVRDPAYALPLVYIDDVVDCMLATMENAVPPPPPGHFAAVSPVHETTLGFLAATIQSFGQNRETLALPELADPLTQKLYATWLSYLPTDAFAYPLKPSRDERGSFTEFLRTPDRGQVSINVAKPGVIKGNHWHDTKNEKFLVVSGRAAIHLRRLGDSEVIEYITAGEEPTVVDIPTGYTHNIENIGEGDLVTVMWASEPFNPDKPDTYFEKV